MSKTGAAPLKQSIVTLFVVVQELEMDEDQAAIWRVIGAALRAPQPRKVLNLRLGQLRRARPGIFRRLSAWLRSAEVKHQACFAGAHWAWMEWRRACWRMHRGQPAHAAFGMDKGGRPERGFPCALDAAIYALHQQDQGDATPLDTLLETAATIFGARLDEVRRHLPAALGLSAEDREKAAKSPSSRLRRGETP